MNVPSLGLRRMAWKVLFENDSKLAVLTKLLESQVRFEESLGILQARLERIQKEIQAWEGRNSFHLCAVPGQLPALRSEQLEGSLAVAIEYESGNGGYRLEWREDVAYLIETSQPDSAFLLRVNIREDGGGLKFSDAQIGKEFGVYLRRVQNSQGRGNFVPTYIKHWLNDDLLGVRYDFLDGAESKSLATRFRYVKQALAGFFTVKGYRLIDHIPVEALKEVALEKLMKKEADFHQAIDVLKTTAPSDLSEWATTCAAPLLKTVKVLHECKLELRECVDLCGGFIVIDFILENLKSFPRFPSGREFSKLRALISGLKSLSAGNSVQQAVIRLVNMTNLLLENSMLK